MTAVRQAVILAGGKGTRLAARLNGRPKPLVDIDGVPLLARQLDALRAGGFTDVLLLVNHAADQIEAFIGSGVANGMRVALLDDGEPRGTAGALTQAMGHLAPRFLVVYGDTLFDVDLAHLWDAHLASGAAATLLLHPNDHPFDSDLVEIDPTGRVVAMHGVPHPPDAWLPNLVNGAMYVLEREAITFWDAAPSDIARDLFPAMLRRGQHLHGYVSGEYIKDIGTPKRLDKAVAQLRAGVVARARRTTPQRAVFVARDGTINLAPDGMKLAAGAASAVRRLNEAEYRVVVVGNAPASPQAHGKMETLLGREGGFVDRVDCTPSGTAAAIDRARSGLNLDLEHSWLIGDSTADIAAAAARGVTSVLVRTGTAARDVRHAAVPDFVAADLADAVSLMLDRLPVLAARAEALAAHCRPSAVVLVGGLARSGKSSLAGALAWRLRRAGQPAMVVALDHWLRAAADRTPGVLGRYDMAAAEQAVADLAAGHPVAPPAYDALSRSSLPDGHRLVPPRGGVLIVEGCPALLSDHLRGMATRRIHVECHPDIQRARFVAEYRRRGLPASEIEALYAAREADEHIPIRAASALADETITLPDIAGP